MEISVTGLNHKRAPVELREKLAVDDAALQGALADLQKGLSAREMVILSTCNRVEFYAAHEGEPPALEAVAGVLAARHGVPASALEPALYRHQGSEAVRHLFRVASSLDSMVLGEAQITGQVRSAYEAAREAGATGRIFNRLFQHALKVAGRVRSTTSIGEKQVSVPSVASRLAEKVFQDLASKRVLILGAGETGELTAAAFRNRGVTRFLVVNRTIENARALAGQVGGEAHGLDDLPRVLPLADVVIACIRSDAAVLGVEQVEAAMVMRRRDAMFLIDIAVPRNIHPAVNDIDNVYLYDIDDLQSIVQQNVSDREREVDRCLPLVEEEVEAFLSAVTPEDVGVLLKEIREKLHALGEEELQRTLSRLNGLSEAQRQEVTELKHRVINKILHPPSEALRGGALGSSSRTIIELVRKLFGIKR